MGVIKQGILGGFSGKVGGVVGSSWKGIAVMKALPLSVSQPNTAKQLAAKEVFSQNVVFAKSVLTDVIKPCLDRPAVQMSGYNYFMNLSKGAFKADGRTDYAKIRVSVGRVHGGSDLAGSVQ